MFNKACGWAKKQKKSDFYVNKALKCAFFT